MAISRCCFADDDKEMDGMNEKCSCRECKAICFFKKHNFQVVRFQLVKFPTSRPSLHVALSSNLIQMNLIPGPTLKYIRR